MQKRPEQSRDDADLNGIAALVAASGAVEHCTALTASLFARARRNLFDDARLSPPLRDALAGVCQYMIDLYDTDSDVSRLYLQARPDIQAPACRAEPPRLTLDARRAARWPHGRGTASATMRMIHSPVNNRHPLLMGMFGADSRS